MKNKFLIAAAFAAVSVAASASVVSEAWLCQIALDVNTPDTVIALPLVSVGGTQQTISPADYVLTTGLANNDYMYAVIDGTPKCWVVSEGKWTTASVSAYDGTYAAADAGTAVARGSALVLHVEGASSESVKTVYLYGQYSGEALVSPATGGSKAKPVYTLMGNPNAAEVDLTEIPWGTKPASGDRIAVPSAMGRRTKEYIAAVDGETVSWKDNSVSVDENGIPTLTSTTVASGSVKFPAGSGFWYVSRSSTAATISWPAAAAQ